MEAQDPTGDPVRAKEFADSERAEAGAQKAKAGAQKAQAEADKAKAEAQEAQAQADKAKAQAVKAQREVDESVESDPAVAAARRASRVAELAKSKAEADAATQKAGVPEAPTIATIAEPADKSTKVDDTGGKATAGLTAVHALQLVAEGIGDEIVGELTGVRRPAAPAVRQREPSFVDRVLNRRAGPQPLFAATSPPDSSEARKYRIWMMESTSTATGDLLRIELTRRLEGFKKLFAPAETEVPVDILEPLESKGLEGIAADGAGAALGGAAAAAGGPGAFAAVAALTTATSLARFGVELASALRGRYALFGRDVELNRTALMAGVAGRVAQSGINVKWRRFAPVDRSPLMDLFGETMAAREEFASTALIEPLPADDYAKQAAYERLKKLVAAFDAYAAEITKPGTSGSSPLVEAAATEFFEPPDELSDEDYLLYVDLSAKGADAMTGYGLLKGSTAAFLGFTQAYYALVRRDGTVVTSGSITDDVAARLHLDTAVLELPAHSSSVATRS